MAFEQKMYREESSITHAAFNKLLSEISYKKAIERNIIISNILDRYLLDNMDCRNNMKSFQVAFGEISSKSNFDLKNIKVKIRNIMNMQSPNRPSTKITFSNTRSVFSFSFG